MNRRRMFTLATMLLTLAASSAVAQQPADIERVKAASKAFYAALAVLDDGTAMESVGLHTIRHITRGLKSKSAIVGWDAQKKYWEDFNKRFSQRGVSLVDAHIHANGNLAWEMGVEMVQAQLKDGTIRKVDWMVTNVYEKIDGRWLGFLTRTRPRGNAVRSPVSLAPGRHPLPAANARRDAFVTPSARSGASAASRRRQR